MIENMLQMYSQLPPAQGGAGFLLLARFDRTLPPRPPSNRK